MADQVYKTLFNIGGVNLYTNPLFQGFQTGGNSQSNDGAVIRSINFDSDPLGAKMKRPGYTSFLNSLGTQTQNLSSWTMDNGTSIFLYNYSGGTMFYYDAGIGTGTTWNVCGNGTFTGTHVGGAILGNTLIIGDGVGSTRHSTDGTSFTNTTLAPAGEFFEQYINRIFIGGTSSTLFYSCTGDATNWNLSGTSDSSSLTIPGAGRLNRLYKLGDRLHIGKSQGNVFRWDGYSLMDTSTNLGPISPYSYGTVEDNGFYLNWLGVYLADISGPKIISNPVGRLIYNELSTGIQGTVFQNAPGVVHRYDYYLSVGSTRDDFTNEPFNNAILKYNFVKNEWLPQQFNNKPTAFASYKDNVGSQQMIFADANGQTYKYGGTALADNGVAIPAVLDMVFNFTTPHLDKDWRWMWMFFNPGCEAQIQVAMANTFTKGAKQWIDLGDARSGVVSYRFPTNSRSKILYVRIKESSTTSRMVFYGLTLGAIIKDPG